MIRKSRYRFSEKIMLKQKDGARWRSDKTPSRRASAGAEIDLLHLRIVGQIGRRAGQNASADLQHGREIRDLQRELDRLLGEQDRQPFLVQPAEESRTSIRPPPARGRATARPASGAWDRSSARGRPPASAARRRTWCRRAGCAARRASGRFRRPDRAVPRCAPCRAAGSRQAADCSRRFAARTAASLPATAPGPCARSHNAGSAADLLAAKPIDAGMHAGSGRRWR